MDRVCVTILTRYCNKHQPVMNISSFVGFLTSLGVFLSLPSVSLQVKQCLTCDGVPVNCTPSAIHPSQPSLDSEDSYVCETDVSNCTLETCSLEEDAVCASSFSLPLNQDFSQTNGFTSHCFPSTIPCHAEVVMERCGFPSMGYSKLPFIVAGNSVQYECCCNTTNCVAEVFGVVAMFDVMVTNSTSQTTAQVMSSISIIVPIATIIVILLVVLGAAVLIPILVYFCGHCKTSNPSRRRNVELNDSHYSVPLTQPWVIQGLVGQGRFGHVYTALYKDKIVAIKVYSHQNRSSWENECHIYSMTSTRHANIVEYIRCSDGVPLSTSNQLSLLMHYYPLGSLESYLRNNMLSWKQACTIVRCISCGLSHLHSDFYISDGDIRMEKYPIAHRDIKSSNILLKSDCGDCVIGDLGLGLKLMATNDAKEISNYGQVGTVRYMSPEALEARVNLLDLESFKQIDVYALSLIMWEVLSRCCVLTPDSVEPYQLPYEDLVVHPTRNDIKDIVCTRQLRPPIPALWSNHEPLITYAAIMEDCWERDPDARLTSANICYQMSDLCTLSLQNIRTQTPVTPQAPISRTQSHVSHVINTTQLLHLEDSQSGPPPCYCPTDPYQNLHRTGMRRFQTSMPHIATHATEETHPRSSRSLRSSVTQSFHYHGNGRGGYHPPLSVRNSLVLGDRRVSLRDDPLPVFSDSSSTSASSIPGDSARQVYTESEPDRTIPCNDSGIQVAHSDSPQSNSEDSRSDSSSLHSTVVS